MFRRHTLTPAGLIFLGVTAFVLTAAINSGTNLLYLAFGVLLGGFLVSIVFARLSVARMDVRRVMIDHVVAGEPAHLQYVLTNRKRFFPCFAIRITEAPPHADALETSLLQVPEGYAFHIPPGQSATIPARLVPAHRGLLTLPAVRLTCGFPFGFMNHTVDLAHPDSLVVYPRIGALNRHLALRCRESTESGTMTSAIRRGNDEFYGLREYRAGDNIRSIHWRSTARTGQLTIREMGANAPPQMVVVLNLRGWRSPASAVAGADDASQRALVERAIELAAAILCYAFLENFAVALAIPGLDAEFPPLPHMGREARAAALHRLATLTPDQLRADVPFPLPNRLTSRAEWVIITLRSSDAVGDLYPPSAHHTLLPLDAPEAPEWVRFVSGQDPLRLLRESEPPTVAGPHGLSKPPASR